MTETAQNEGQTLVNPVAEGLMGKLARYPGRDFRKGYLASLMASGNRLSEAGNARAAAYCFDKVAEALKDVAGPEADAETAGSGSPGGTSQSGRRKGSQAESPLEILRFQWRKDRLLDAEAVLRRQGGRLSSLENRIYREKLEKLRASGESGLKAGTKSPASKVDISLLDLRRQLYRRVLKSQKVSMRRRALPATALRQAFLLPGTTLPGAEPISNQSNPAARMDLPETPGQAKPTGLQTIIGPYNDRYNLGDLLTLVAQADATWVEEFLDLYRGLIELKGLVTALPAQARK